MDDCRKLKKMTQNRKSAAKVEIRKLRPGWPEQDSQRAGVYNDGNVKDKDTIPVKKGGIRFVLIAKVAGGASRKRQEVNSQRKTGEYDPQYMKGLTKGKTYHLISWDRRIHVILSGTTP